MKKSDTGNSDQKILDGVVGVRGITMGRASLYRRSTLDVSTETVEAKESEQELADYRHSLDKARAELQAMAEKQDGNEATALVGTQIEMLKDPELNNRAEQLILRENYAADAAVKKAFDSYLDIIKENDLGDDDNRAVDVMDVRDRLIQILNGHHDDGMAADRILVAEELSPREVIVSSERGVKGIIMDDGGINAHAAIIARSIGLPTILATQSATSTISDDDELVLDGLSGCVVVNPDEDSKQEYQHQVQRHQERLKEYAEICKQPNETNDGTAFCLRANVEFSEELTMLKKYCAQGIGLLRTESIYLRRSDFEDPENQQSFYNEILGKTGSYPVTIRLFDAGGDKIMGYDYNESNPFLGWRGIRLMLEQKEFLEQQLRAICRSAAQFTGRVRILIPMITTLRQYREVKDMLEKIQSELQAEGKVDHELQLGIMVEVPNVAMQADVFAEEADFLSIGTNDLTQYLLAVDRGNERISRLYDQRHPMMWELISKVVDAAQKYEKPLNVCGELASDPAAACCLMGMGIRELSMNPSALPRVKTMLRGHSISEMQELCRKVRECQLPEQVHQLFDEWEES